MKYLAVLKIKIVFKYLANQNSLLILDIEYGIEYMTNRNWVELVSKLKDKYTYLHEFKLNVVVFYHVHHMVILKVSTVLNPTDTG